jgi:hypothetical protein
MSEAIMFVIYAADLITRYNVTLSPRKSFLHDQPGFDPSAQATLLPGSGVSGGVMTANIKC